jgi:LacI family sucrose operon transcriptional repressor
MARKSSGKVKFKDIAEACGVSLVTISRYFNKPELLSDPTRTKIEATIGAMGYTQDSLARILATGESNLFGIILPHLHSGFYTELLSELIEYGKQRNCVFIPYTSSSAQEELKIIENLISYHIKGLILLSPLLSVPQIEALSVPVITIERAAGNFMHINNDNFEGGKLAAELLIQNNCEVFIHINNDYDTKWPSFKRIVGFEFMIHDRPYKRFIERSLTDPLHPDATIAMERIFKQIMEEYGQKKLGVFCSNDDLAQLFERQCIINHVSIPSQVELIGYDNSYISKNAVYPITSLDQNISTMAQIAIDSFDNYIPHECIVPCRMIRKQTTS